MARRNDHTRAELSALFLDTACKIVAEEGVTALSVRKITSRIGYTGGTLYQIFTNLDDVILHVNGLTLDELFSVLGKTPTGNGSIYQMAKCYITYSQQHFNRWNALFIHNLPTDAVMPDWYQKKITTIFSLLEERVAMEIGADQARVARTARILWAGLHGICTLSLHGKLDRAGAEAADILADDFVRYFMAGVKGC